MSRLLPTGNGDFTAREVDFLMGVGRGPLVKTADYTVTLPDLRNVIVMDAAGANTVTIPRKGSGFFPDAGAAVIVLQAGAGLTTLVAGSGVTINSLGGLVSQGQGAWFGAWCLDDDIYWAFGNLTT